MFIRIKKAIPRMLTLLFSCNHLVQASNDANVGFIMVDLSSPDSQEGFHFFISVNRKSAFRPCRNLQFNAIKLHLHAGPFHFKRNNQQVKNGWSSFWLEASENVLVRKANRHIVNRDLSLES